MITSKSITELLKDVKVEWKSLGDVATLQRGKVISKLYLLKNKGSYPVYSSQTVNHGQIGKINTYDFDGEFINWTTDGAYAGTVFYRKGKFSITNVSGLIKLNKSSCLDYKFLYYWLTIEAKKYVYSGMGNPKLMSNQMEKVLIPIPPIDIQKKIVRILDTFTTMTAELTAELNIRKQQYNYYRDKLLTFGDNEVEWKFLDEIGEVRMCKRILKNQTTNFGDIPFYKIGTFGKSPDAFISRNLFKEYKTKFSYPNKGEILISASGTIGRTVIFDGKDSYFQDSNIIWIENNENIILNRYLFFFYQTINWDSFTDGGTIKRLYSQNLKKIQIPFPPLSEQKRIVEILDKFDSLINSITEGLPREIELRQKQYEYYRNLLLDFPRVNV